MSLVIRDQETGQVKVFDTTKEGYAQAEAYKQQIVGQGHRVSDDNSGSLGKLGSFFGTSSW